MPSPTALTLRWLRHSGHVAGVVERWLKGVDRRSDFLGCMDIIGAKAGEPVVGVQATSAANVGARVSKARRIPELRTWLASGARFLVVGWTKVGKKWLPKVVELHGNDLLAEVVATIPRKRRKSRWQPGDLFAAES